MLLSRGEWSQNTLPHVRRAPCQPQQLALNSYHMVTIAAILCVLQISCDCHVLSLVALTTSDLCGILSLELKMAQVSFVLSGVSQPSHELSSHCVCAVCLWNSSWDLVASFVGHLGAVTSLATFPTGPYVMSSSVDATVRVWNLETMDETERWVLTQSLHVVGWL